MRYFIGKVAGRVARFCFSKIHNIFKDCKDRIERFAEIAYLTT